MSSRRGTVQAQAIARTPLLHWPRGGESSAGIFTRTEQDQENGGRPLKDYKLPRPANESGRSEVPERRPAQAWIAACGAVPIWSAYTRDWSPRRQRIELWCVRGIRVLYQSFGRRPHSRTVGAMRLVERSGTASSVSAAIFFRGARHDAGSCWRGLLLVHRSAMRKRFWPMNIAMVAISVFVGLVVCLEIGYRVGARRVQKTRHAHEGFGAVEGAVFGIFGLLLSLSFFGSASRLDARRQLIIQEANAIGAAYTRVDLLPQEEQPELRRLFRDYLDLRLRISQTPEEEIVEHQLLNSARFQREIWSRATMASNKDASGGARLLLPAINEMVSVANSKTITVQTHLPGLVLAFLIGATLLSGLVAGFGMARGARNWLSIFVYAALVSTTLYVMMDMEYPRRGLIRIGAADVAMIKLRDAMYSANAEASVGNSF